MSNAKEPTSKVKPKIAIESIKVEVTFSEWGIAAEVGDGVFQDFAGKITALDEAEDRFDTITIGRMSGILVDLERLQSSRESLFSLCDRERDLTELLDVFDDDGEVHPELKERIGCEGVRSCLYVEEIEIEERFQKGHTELVAMHRLMRQFQSMISLFVSTPLAFKQVDDDVQNLSSHERRMIFDSMSESPVIAKAEAIGLKYDNETKFLVRTTERDLFDLKKGLRLAKKIDAETNAKASANARLLLK